jgi:hypothetical protein
MSALSRRRFLFALASLTALPRPARALRVPLAHPDPRKGITAAKVLKAGELHTPEAAEYFEMARQIPQVLDGIRCQCGCAVLEGYRSVLSCFEGDGMAQHCQICQGEVKLAYQMHKDGKTLAAIRAAVDKEFG